MLFPRGKRTLYQKIIVVIAVITAVFWVFSYLLARQFLKNAIWSEFSGSIQRTMEGIARQSVNEIKYSDYFEIQRVLQGFYDEKFMRYIAIYTSDRQLMAMYPRQLSGEDYKFMEEKIFDNAGTPYVQDFLKRSGGQFFHFGQQIKDENGNVVGLIAIGGTTKHLAKVLNTQTLFFAALGFFVLVIQIAAIGYASRVVTKPLNELTTMLQKNEEIEPEKFLPTFAHQTLPKGASSEVSVFYSVYQKLLQNIHAHIMHAQEAAVQTSIGKVASQVAHDLRSPISVLKGFVESVNDGGDGDLAEYKASARRSVEKMVRMADDLVDYTKAKQINTAPTRICELLKNIVSELSDSAHVKGANIDVDCQNNLIAHVDGHKMDRVLVNLVQNAVHALPAANGKIKLKAEILSDGWLIISVEDNGHGIEEKYLPRVFDSSFTFGKPSGTGLGLSYCRNVVEAHGGRISAESSAGKGSKFIIEMPLTASRLAAESGTEEAVPGAAVIPESAKSILVIDDDADILKQWSRLLKNITPFEVVAVSGPRELYSLNPQPGVFRAAISDYRFDGVEETGIDLIKFLKGKGIPCRYLCTGFYYDPALRKEAISAGAHAIIPKPIPEELVKQLFG